MVADLWRVDVGAHTFDHAGSLVAEDHRQRIAQRSADHLEIGMAKARRPHPDHHIARRRIADGHMLDDKRCASLMEHGGTVS